MSRLKRLARDKFGFVNSVMVAKYHKKLREQSEVALKLKTVSESIKSVYRKIKSVAQNEVL